MLGREKAARPLGRAMSRCLASHGAQEAPSSSLALATMLWGRETLSKSERLYAQPAYIQLCYSGEQIVSFVLLKRRAGDSALIWGSMYLLFHRGARGLATVQLVKQIGCRAL